MSTSPVHREPRGLQLSSSDSVKRVFALQEERKAEYDKLKRAQDTYTSSVDPLSSESLSRYQSEIGAITSTLSNISQELNQLSKGLREQDVAQASSIIEEIQTKEKEKLQLVVEYQVSVQRLKQSAEEEEDFTGAGDNIRWMPELRGLRRKLAMCDTGISSLLEELRYECEDLLVT